MLAVAATNSDDAYQVRRSDPTDWRVMVEIAPDIEQPVYQKRA